MSTGPTINRGGSKQNYRTPDDFRAALRKRFGIIKFDLAAEPDNTLVPDRFYTKEQNSLIQQWYKIEGEGWLFLNPEYADIETWAAKCAAESALGARILFLTPASIGSNWFKQWALPSAVVIGLNGRLCFIENWQTTIDPASVKRGDPQFYKTEPSYPKDLMLSAFCNGLTGFQTWTWK